MPKRAASNRTTSMHPGQHRVCRMWRARSAVFWEKRKREAGKMQRLSPMRPQTPPRVLGKARFNWTPTRDLVRPWPMSIFTWGVIVVGVALRRRGLRLHVRLLARADLEPARARDVSTTSRDCARGQRQLMHDLPHADRQHGVELRLVPPDGSLPRQRHHAARRRRASAASLATPNIAARTSAPPPSRDFRRAPVVTTTSNKQVYQRRRVGTPHGGTFGYPVVERQVGVGRT